jgi:hypothetical protein
MVQDQVMALLKQFPNFHPSVEPLRKYCISLMNFLDFPPDFPQNYLTVKGHI